MGIVICVKGEYYWFKNVEELMKILYENCDTQGYARTTELYIEFTK